MLEQLKYLVEIQILEDRKNALIRGSEETPRNVATLEKEFELIEGEYLRKKEDHEEALKTRKTLEQEIVDLDAKAGRSRQRMNEVKTNKEYQALMKETEDVKKEILRREDSILELMVKIDALGKEILQAKEEMEGHGRKLAEDKENLRHESDMVNERLSRLESLQEKVRKKVQPVLLKRCHYLFEKHGGVATAAVANGVCQLCHMNIPPQKYIELQRDENILQCPHCNRFIYWSGNDDYKEVPGKFEID